MEGRARVPLGHPALLVVACPLLMGSFAAVVLLRGGSAAGAVALAVLAPLALSTLAALLLLGVLGMRVLGERRRSAAGAGAEDGARGQPAATRRRDSAPGVPGRDGSGPGRPGVPGRGARDLGAPGWDAPGWGAPDRGLPGRGAPGWGVPPGDLPRPNAAHRHGGGLDDTSPRATGRRGIAGPDAAGPRSTGPVGAASGEAAGDADGPGAGAQPRRDGAGRARRADLSGRVPVARSEPGPAELAAREDALRETERALLRAVSGRSTPPYEQLLVLADRLRWARLQHAEAVLSLGGDVDEDLRDELSLRGRLPRSRVELSADQLRDRPADRPGGDAEPGCSP